MLVSAASSMWPKAWTWRNSSQTTWQSSCLGISITPERQIVCPGDTLDPCWSPAQPAWPGQKSQLERKILSWTMRLPLPHLTPSHLRALARGRHWILTVMGSAAAWSNKTKVESSTKALGSHMSPDIAGSFSGMQLMCQAVLSACLSKPEEGTVLGQVLEMHSRWIWASPEPHSVWLKQRYEAHMYSLPPVQRTGRRGLWTGVPARHLPVVWPDHTFLLHRDPQCSSSPGSAQLALGMCFSVGCVGDWAGRWMNGLMTVLSSMKSVQWHLPARGVGGRVVEITYVKKLAQFLLVDAILSIFLRFPPAPVYITPSSTNVVLFILKLIFFFIFPIMVYCKVLNIVSCAVQ